MIAVTRATLASIAQTGSSLFAALTVVPWRRAARVL
jgi:hypothetical protein